MRPAPEMFFGKDPAAFFYNGLPDTLHLNLQPGRSRCKNIPESVGGGCNFSAAITDR
jgi:hypothetical protein